MRFKKSILGLLFAALFAAPTFAISNPTSDKETSTSQTLQEIKSIIQDLNLDFNSLNQKTVKVTFMLNSDNRIIVLDTDNTDVDATLKYSLNYKEIKNSDLVKNKIYVLPVSFKAV